MQIFYLKETWALLFSVLISFLVNYSSVYLGDTAKSWWYYISEVRIFRNTCLYNKKYMRRRYKPWLDSYTIYVGRLLKENLFFKENDISKPKMWIHTYFFIYTMIFDIIFYTLFVFLSYYIFYAYFLFGYVIFKILIHISIVKYHSILDIRYYKKENEDWNIREKAINKIKESNPHFFNLYDPIFNEKHADELNQIIDGLYYKKKRK